MEYPSVTFAEDSVRVETSAKANLQRRGMNAYLFPGLFILMAIPIALTGFRVIREKVLLFDYDDAVFYAVVIGFVVFLLLGAAILLFQLISRGRNVVVADSWGLRTSTRIGSWTPIKWNYPWSKVKWVQLQPDSAFGPVAYGTSMGPGYFGLGLDPDEAQRVADALEAWRLRAGEFQPDASPLVVQAAPVAGQSGNAVRGQLSPGAMKLLRVLYPLLVVGVVLFMYYMIVPTSQDEARLDAALRPLVARDYPGWQSEAFAY